MNVNIDHERALESLPIYPMIVAMREPCSPLGFYMDGEPCPNCSGLFLYGLELDPNGAPLHYCRCTLCGWEAVDVALLLQHHDPFETQPVHAIKETDQ
jgi:hypothetical protein